MATPSLPLNSKEKETKNMVSKMPDDHMCSE
jgi:hypothetical protein